METVGQQKNILVNFAKEITAFTALQNKNLLFLTKWRHYTANIDP